MRGTARISNVHDFSRRSFFFALGGGSACLLPARTDSSRKCRIKIGMGTRDVAETTLRFVSQLGIEWIACPPQYLTVGHPRGLVPEAGRLPTGTTTAWKEEDIRRVKDRVESFGLRLGNLSLPAFPNVILGSPERDRDIECVQESIRVAGKIGVPVVEYSFQAIRASEGYFTTDGRGGATLRAFDESRTQSLAAIPHADEFATEKLWERLAYFLKAVVPVAERAGVRLALHPNDPPVESFRGTGQPLRTMADLKRLIAIVNSPANGITLDAGVTREMGADVVETIRYFGSRDRVNHVHFRNVRLKTAYTSYTETFIDDGDNDMLAAMRAFHDVGYTRMMIPDYTPRLSVDSTGAPEVWAGWAFALGYMKALLKAVESERALLPQSP